MPSKRASKKDEVLLQNKHQALPTDGRLEWADGDWPAQRKVFVLQCPFQLPSSPASTLASPGNTGEL